MNNIVLNQSDCYKSCNNVSCDAATTEYGDGITEFVDCDFDGTINLKSLKEDSEKISMTLEINISEVSLSTAEIAMEFTIVSPTGSEFEGNFYMLYEIGLNSPHGTFSYKLSMPSYEVSKLRYDFEHNCMFTEDEKVGPQQCNEEVSFKKLPYLNLPTWHKGQITVEFKLK